MGVAVTVFSTSYVTTLDHNGRDEVLHTCGCFIHAYGAGCLLSVDRTYAADYLLRFRYPRPALHVAALH